MKFSHIHLEEGRSNPSYLKNLTSSGYGGRGRYSYWQDAVGHYHKSGNLPDVGEKHIIEKFGRFVQNANAKRELDAYLHKYQKYVESYEALDNTTSYTAKLMDMDISFGNRLGGRINRIDESDSGLEAYLFIKESSIWTAELRFPLIQAYIAQYFNRKLSEIRVGTFCLETEEHESRRFSKGDVEGALEEIRNLSYQLTLP